MVAVALMVGLEAFPVMVSRPEGRLGLRLAGGCWPS